MAYPMIPTYGPWPTDGVAPDCPIVKITYEGPLEHRGRCGLFLWYTDPSDWRRIETEPLLKLRLIPFSANEEEVYAEVHPNYVRIVPPITSRSQIYESVTRTAQNEYWRQLTDRPAVAKRLIFFVMNIPGHKVTEPDMENYFVALFRGNETDEAARVLLHWNEASPVSKPSDLFLAHSWKLLTLRELTFRNDVNKSLDLASMIKEGPGWRFTEVLSMKLELLIKVTKRMRELHLPREKEGWELVLRINPYNLTALYGLGELLMRRGRFSEAIKLWQNALKCSYAFDPIQRHIFYQLIELAMWFEAYAVLDGASATESNR